MKPYPPGTDQLVVPTGIPFLFIFVGAPECHQQAKRQKAYGFYNHLTLSYPGRCCDYRWPVNDCGVIVLMYQAVGADIETELIALLCHDGATEVVLRHPPDPALLIRRRRRHE